MFEFGIMPITIGCMFRVSCVCVCLCYHLAFTQSNLPTESRSAPINCCDYDKDVCHMCTMDD